MEEPSNAPRNRRAKQSTIFLGGLLCNFETVLNWGYRTKSLDGESLETWPTAKNLGLQSSPKDVDSFFSLRWKVGTDPDLAFASVGHDNRLTDRRVLAKFTRWQHRPSLITPARLKVPACSYPVKRRNFRKARCKRFCPLTGESVERLPPTDTTNIGKAYQELCDSLIFVAKQCIPPSRRKNYVPSWVKECESEAIHLSFLRVQVGTDFDRAATSLISQLENKMQELLEAVNSTEFSHSRGKVWSATNKLAGRPTDRHFN